MNVLNEQFQLVNTALYANQILSEGLGQTVVTEQEAQNALVKLYLQNYDLQNEKIINHNKKTVFLEQKVDEIKNNLWIIVKGRFCEIVQGESTVGKIVETILNVIASVIPLGVFIKALIKIIVSFFIQQGVEMVCKVN